MVLVSACGAERGQLNVSIGAGAGGDAGPADAGDVAGPDDTAPTSTPTPPPTPMPSGDTLDAGPSDASSSLPDLRTTTPTTPDSGGGVESGGTDAASLLPALPWPAASAIVAAVKPPVFPAKTCAVTDYGGKGDGTTDNTAAFAAAIDACAQAGGGHVVVPAGQWVTGAIALQNKIDLHVDAGATVLFGGDETKYPLVLTRYQGIELMNRSPMIYAYQQSNIAVTGEGTLDASQTTSWNRTDAAAFTTLVGWGDSGTPVKDRILPADTRLRTSFLMPYQSHDILIQGITVKGGPFWQIHPTLSSNVTLRDVSTNSTASEASALVIESSDNVVLQNGTFVAGADCIALKSGRDNDGRRINKPTKNVVLIHARCQGAGGLLAVGSEETGGVQSIFGYDLGTMGTGIDQALFLKATPTRGGTVRDINLDTLVATKLRGTFMSATMTYIGVTTGDFPPTFGDVTLSHVTVDGAARVLDLQGLPASQIGPVNLSDAAFTNIVQTTSSLANVKAVNYTRVTVNGVAPN
ncbi:MAG TPA: glycosyl hydrolase family 28-related protein [Polyangia bacterium]|nr:glycosyl hydrolase family 28-related protein [Polyangia bacterium]